MLQIASLIAKQAERAGHDGRRGEDGSPQGQAQFTGLGLRQPYPKGHPNQRCSLLKRSTNFAGAIDCHVSSAVVL